MTRRVKSWPSCGVEAVTKFGDLELSEQASISESVSVKPVDVTQ